MHTMEGRLTSWEQLADINKFNPVEFAKYSEAKGINEEAAFVCRVDFTLKKINHIVYEIIK